MANYAGFALEPAILAPQWPSALPAQITTRLPITSLDIHQGVSKSFVSTTDPAVVGASDADVLSLMPTASGAMALRYGGLEALLVCALGLEARRLDGDVFPQEVAPGVWLHRFEIDPVLSAMAPWDVAHDGIEAGDLTALTQRKVRRGTLAAVRDDVSVWEVLSCMLGQLSLAWRPDGCTASWEAVGHSLGLNSSVNTLVTMAQAVPNRYPNVRFWDLTIRLAPYSASVPLNSTHALGVASASITLQNPLAVAPSPRTHLYAEEPERSGPALVQGSLLAPRYVHNTLVTAWTENTRYSLDLKATGPLIAQSGYRFQFNCYVPGLFFTQVEPSPLSVGRSSVPVNWYAAAPPARAAGFPVTTYNGPLAIEVVSDAPLHTLLAV
jgi:hypothetical protein